MINKSVNVNIKTQGVDEATQEFKDLGKATEVANDSVEGLNRTFEQVYGELQPLTTRMGEAEDRLYELALAGDTTSREYQELLTKVGQYRKVQIQTDLAVDAAATTLSQKLGGALTGATSGFAAIQGAIGLVSTESEQLNAVLLRVQSALALSQGVQGVKDAIPAFKQLGQVAVKALTSIRNALGALGVGALVFGITFLVTKFDEIKEILGINNKSLEEQLELEKQITEEKQKQLKDMNEFVTNNQKFIDNQIQIIKNEEKLKSLNIDSEKNATKILNLTKETIGLELENLRARLASTEELLSTQEKLQIKTEIFRKEQELLRVDEQALADARKKNSTKKEEQDQKAIDDAEKLAQLERERLLNLENLRNQLLDEIAEVEEENFERTLTEQENEERAVEEKYFRLIELAKQNGLDTNELEIGRLNELNDIKLKFGEQAQEQQDALDAKAAAKQKAKDDKERSDAKALADYRVQVATQSLSAISDIAELFSKGNEKQAKRAFQIQKAVGIAQATINTAQAITKVFAETTDFTPTQSLRVANAVAIGLAGAAQVASIASQQFQGGGTGGTDVSVDTATQAPQFNVVGDSGVNQLAQLQQQPTQAFVVSGEVTTAQALDRNRVQNATL